MMNHYTFALKNRSHGEIKAVLIDKAPEYLLAALKNLAHLPGGLIFDWASVTIDEMLSQEDGQVTLRWQVAWQAFLACSDVSMDGVEKGRLTVRIEGEGKGEGGQLCFSVPIYEERSSADEL